MLRREPTSVTLTAQDIEIFKTLIRLQQESEALSKLSKQVHNEDVDEIFMGRSIGKKRSLTSRLDLAEEEEDEDVEGPLYKKLNMST